MIHWSSISESSSDICHFAKVHFGDLLLFIKNQATSSAKPKNHLLFLFDNSAFSAWEMVPLDHVTDALMLDSWSRTFLISFIINIYKYKSNNIYILYKKNFFANIIIELVSYKEKTNSALQNPFQKLDYSPEGRITQHIPWIFFMEFLGIYIFWDIILNVWEYTSRKYICMQPMNCHTNKCANYKFPQYQYDFPT